MAQTKAQRSAAAKKAAATRARNRREAEAKASAAGKKAAATRQDKQAEQASGQAKRAASSMVKEGKAALLELPGRDRLLVLSMSHVHRRMVSRALPRLTRL